MKTSQMIGLVAVSVLSFNLVARADCGDTNSEDCNINGCEVMDAVIVMDATSNAPAGATGIAKIESGNTNGNEAAEIDLKTVGLAPGEYDLSITLQSTGSNVDLGLFTVGSEDDDGGDGGWGGFHPDYWGGGSGNNGQSNWIPCNWGGFTNWGVWTNWCDTNFVAGGCWGRWFGTGHGNGSNTNGCSEPSVTRTETDLPAGIDPTDIGQITVADTNGNPILVGNLVTPAPGTAINISGAVQVAAGNASPYLDGTAQVQSTVKNGKWMHHFTLTANGANAKTSYKVTVNGKFSGATRSNKSGQLALKKLPSRTAAVRSVQIIDLHGNVAASAKF